MNILGDKLIRDTGFLILKTKNLVFKFPMSFSAFKEITVEKKILRLVEKDQHFKKYLPHYHFSPWFISTSLMMNFLKSRNAESLIKNYFKEAFINQDQWLPVPLSDVPSSQYFLSFTRRHSPGNHDRWKNFLNRLIIARSSSHGDFYPDNILVDDNRLFFIDWPQYDEFSSRFFDLINFYVFSAKSEDSWTKAWQKIYGSGLSVFQGIKVDKKYFVAYAVYKVSKELSILQLRNQLNSYKNQKYINFINQLKKIIDSDRNFLI